MTICHLFPTIISSPYSSPIAGMVAALGGLILGYRDLKLKRDRRAFVELVFGFFWLAQSLIDFSQIKSQQAQIQTNNNAIKSLSNELDSATNSLAQATNEVGKSLWLLEQSRSTRLLKSKFPDLIKQKPAGEIFLFFEPNNGEARGFGENIARILKGDGWTVHPPVSWTPEGYAAAAPGCRLIGLTNDAGFVELNTGVNGAIITLGNADSPVYKGLTDSLEFTGFFLQSAWVLPFPSNRVVVVIGKK